MAAKGSKRANRGAVQDKGHSQDKTLSAKHKEAGKTSRGIQGKELLATGNRQPGAVNAEAREAKPERIKWLEAQEDRLNRLVPNAERLASRIETQTEEGMTQAREDFDWANYDLGSFFRELERYEGELEEVNTQLQQQPASEKEAGDAEHIKSGLEKRKEELEKWISVYKEHVFPDKLEALRESHLKVEEAFATRANALFKSIQADINQKCQDLIDTIEAWPHAVAAVSEKYHVSPYAPELDLRLPGEVVFHASEPF